MREARVYRRWSRRENLFSTRGDDAGDAGERIDGKRKMKENEKGEAK